jgi:hypothetical protein
MLFESIEEALPRVVEIVQHFRRLVDDGTPLSELELEARLGHVDESGAFHASVPREIIDAAVTMVLTNSAIQCSDWREHHDVFWMNGETPVRTRVTFDDADLCVVPHSVRKMQLCRVTTKCGDGLAMRVTLSREQAVSHSKVTCDTEHVRIQQRRTARWSRTRSAQHVWQYDFSLTWNGRTMTMAEKERWNGQPRYELEVELASVTYLRGRSDDYVAKSLLMKLADFCPCGASIVGQTTLSVGA